MWVILRAEPWACEFDPFGVGIHSGKRRDRPLALARSRDQRSRRVANAFGHRSHALKNPPRPGLSACVVVSLLSIALIGCAPATHSPPPTGSDAAADALLELMRERLLVMHDVARWKWNARQPIADPKRERELLDELASRAAEHGLSPDEVRRFMRAQIEAGKLVQQADWQRWEAEGQKDFKDAPDLKTELRPKIDRLSEQLLAAFAAVLPQLAEPAARGRISHRAEQILTGEGIDAGVRATALADLCDGC